MAVNELAAMTPGTPEHTALRGVARLALLSRAAVDIPHPKVRGLRIAGFICQPDEHYAKGDGLKMLDALQTAADLDLKAIQRGLRARMDAPFAIGAETGP